MLCNALHEQGRLEEIDPLLIQLAAIAETDDELVLIALFRSVNLWWGMSRLDDAFVVVEKALAQVPEGPLRESLLGKQATHLVAAGQPIAALKLAEPLLRSPAEPIRLRALVAASWAYPHVARFADAEWAAKQAAAAYAESSDLRGMGPQNGFIATYGRVLCDLGRLSEARQLMTDAYEEAAAAGDVTGQAWSALILGRVALLGGALTTARRWGSEASVVFRRIRQPHGLRWSLSLILLAAAGQRGLGTADVTEAELAAVPTGRVRLFGDEAERAFAWGAVVRGEQDRAWRLLRDAFMGWCIVGAVNPALVILHDLARLGAAEKTVGLLDRLTFPEPWTLGKVMAQHIRSAAAMNGNALQEVADKFAQMGCLLYAAEAASRAVAAWRRQGHNRAAAWAATKAMGLANRCENARTPALALIGNLAQLTPREHEIARLAATGLPNREIAERLCLSERTVENHLNHVYGKLGVRGRVDLPNLL
jgi:DNA-binding CsgD family transcriptional regulator